MCSFLSVSRIAVNYLGTPSTALPYFDSTYSLVPHGTDRHPFVQPRPEKTSNCDVQNANGAKRCCFLVLPHLFGRPREEYRTVRGNLLQALCLVTKLMFTDALDIIGIATDAGIDTVSRSEDALYLNARVWNADMDAYARSLQEDLRLLTSTTEFRNKVSEFPVRQQAAVVTPGRNPRNKPCPCRSGRKYKKCHGA